MRIGLVPIVGAALALAAAGCRFPGDEGPVSESLVASRQLCHQGVSAIERGQWEQAEQVLADAVAKCPVDPDARRHYADALWHRGQREQAVWQLEEASRLALDDATLHMLLAEKRLAMGHVELARQTAQYAIDLDPKLAGAWAIRGRVSHASGQPREALADYHRALGLAPDDREIQLEIAKLYGELSQPRRALAALDNLADAYPSGEEPQQVLYLRGLAYATLERWDEAADSFSAAGAREGPTAEILFQLGRAELMAGRPAQAEAAVRQALALDPRHQPSRELLGQVELVLGPRTSVRR